MADVRRSIQMFRKVNVDVLGIIENMSYFVPPDAPEKKYHIFGEGGGKAVADEYEVPMLGEVPIEMRIREGGDAGTPFVLDPESGAHGDAIRQIASSMVAEVRKANNATASTSVDIQI